MSRPVPTAGSARSGAGLDAARRLLVDHTDRTVTGTLTEPGYTVVDGQLAWEQVLRTPRSTILLPANYEVTTVSVPATVSTQADGRVVIQVFDGRPDEGVTIQVRAYAQDGEGDAPSRPALDFGLR